VPRARRSDERHEHHRHKTRVRAATPSPGPPKVCATSGCRKLTQRSAGDGFSTRFCRDCIKHEARHGSTWRTTPRKADIEPYRRAARCWLKANRDRPMVQRVLAALAGRLAGSGKPQSAWDHHWLSPQDRARSALAMIGARTKDAPEKLIVITLAIWSWLAHLHALDSRSQDFRLTQIGKAAKRLASGTHTTRAGTKMPKPKWPPSSGSYLRIMGRQIDDLAGLLAEWAWSEVLALMQAPKGDGGDRDQPSNPHQPQAPASGPPPGAPAKPATAQDDDGGDDDERDRQWCIRRWGNLEGERMAARRRRMRQQVRGRRSPEGNIGGGS